MLEVAKYLQGKTYRDIKQIVMKMKRMYSSAFSEGIESLEDPLTQV